MVVHNDGLEAPENPDIIDDTPISNIVIRRKLILLAVGIAVLYLLVTLKLGAAIASLLVATFGVFYGALAFLHKTKRDDQNFQSAFVDILDSKFGIATTTLIYGLCLALSVFALGDKSFNVRVVDEFAKPVEAEVVSIEGSWVYSTRETGPGIYRVQYFSLSPLRTLKIGVTHGESTIVETHQRTGISPFTDVTIGIWSGQPLIRTTHVTLEGRAISLALSGELPPSLSKKFGEVALVLNNNVYQSANKLAENYSPESYAYFTEREKYAKGDKDQNISYHFAIDGNEGYDPSGQEGEFLLNSEISSRWDNLRDVGTHVSVVTQDLSNQILGCDLVEPFPAEFTLRVMEASDYFEGAPARPDERTAAWLTNKSEAPYLDDGLYSILLEKPLEIEEAEKLVESSRPVEWGDNINEARRLINFLKSNGAPVGLLRASVILKPHQNACAGEYASNQILILIPAPTLRVTILENVTDQPIRISGIRQSLVKREGFSSPDKDPSEAEITRTSLQSGYELPPGKVIVVPTELGMRAATQIKAPPVDQKDDNSFEALFEIPDVDPLPTGDSGIDPAWLPRKISINSSQIVVSASDNGESIFDEQNYEFGEVAKGPYFTIGSVVTKLNLLLNDVPFQPRSDERVAIGMVGGYSVGSCPFVYINHKSSNHPINIGHIIDGHIGPSSLAPDRVKVGTRFDGIELREIEFEKSYIDSAKLIVIRDGQEFGYPDVSKSLSSDDGDLLVLERGDSVPLEFDYVRQSGDETAYLEITGYYEPIFADHTPLQSAYLN